MSGMPKAGIRRCNAPQITYDALDRWVEQYWVSGFEQQVYTPTGEKFAVMQGASVSTAYVPLPGGAIARYSSSGLGYYLHADWLRYDVDYISTPARAFTGSIAVSPFGYQYVGNLLDSFLPAPRTHRRKQPIFGPFLRAIIIKTRAVGLLRIRRGWLPWISLIRSPGIAMRT